MGGDEQFESLAQLMNTGNPPLTGRRLLQFKSSISGIETDLEQYAKAIELYKSKQNQTKPDNRVRVLLTGVPTVHGAERVMDIIENNGGLVVCTDNCTGLKPILEDVDENADDPIDAIAKKYLNLPCSVMTKNDRRLELIGQLAKEYNAECIIDDFL